MSLDILELALDRFTYWVRFEGLASEIMRDEGYPDIKPLGGVHDQGQDAVVERFFSATGARIRTVFEYSLREDVGSKLAETVSRLKEASVAFDKLVMVTRASMSPESQRALRQASRNEHGIDLEIFERKTLTNRRGDTTTGLFARYFPDARGQVDAMLAGRV
jgi:hypothetical protein